MRILVHVERGMTIEEAVENMSREKHELWRQARDQSKIMAALGWSSFK
jgi:diacylglycerol kinase